MLSVILIWFYMIVTTFLLGYGILTGITHFCPYQVRKWDSYFMCGLAGATVYAQFFSIFAPVGFAANAVLSGICLIIAFLCRKKLCMELQEVMRELKSTKGIWLFILLLLYAYGTSRGMIHYDTSLYHAQSIRWIEEYGVVTGLGNLHCRLAYNSASFALSALYSMSFLGGQSFHCAAGFFALILAKVCSETGNAIKQKRLQVSDFARLAAIYYLFIIFDEMTAPASDYFMVLTAFYCIIRWLDLLSWKEEAVTPYALLCVLGVFLMTVKLSAALILLLTVKPALMLIQRKRIREIGIWLSLGVITALPYFIRNVLISGWLVYPFTVIDLFPVAWKIPKGIADYDAKEIQVWGRGYSDVTRYDIGIFDWFGDWFRGLAGMDKVFTAAAMVSVFLFLITFIRNLFLLKKGKKESQNWDMLLVEATVSFSFLFWLFSSPLIRYGCVYVYLTAAVVIGSVYDCMMHGQSIYGYKQEENIIAESAKEHKDIKWKKRTEKICLVAVELFLLYKAGALGEELIHAYVNDYWIYQKDYDNFETESYEIEGNTFYYPLSGDQTGYDSFPSSPVKAEIGFLGDDLKDGFYSK